MSKKSIIAVLSAVVLMVVASLALVFTVGPKTSADSEEIPVVPVDCLNLTGGGETLGDGNVCGAFNADGKTWIKNNTKYRVEIPNMVTRIDNYAFSYCSGLTSITIPESVTGISYYAFRDCSGLTSMNYTGTLDQWVQISFGTEYSNPTRITKKLIINGKVVTNAEISSDVTKIKPYVFYNCENLTSVTIPSSVTSIGNNAFYNCSGLTSVTIPSSVTSIGTKTFYGCRSLTSITIPEGVTSIGEYAFAYCSDITSSITIPSSVTSIGNGVFQDCSGLTSVTFAENSQLISIGSDTFAYCSGLTSVTIPSSVTSIGTKTFYGCRSLTSITIPEGVTSIGEYAFISCSGLTSIEIPSSVTSIGDVAFYDCSGLTSITIPSSVTSIGNYAFDRCSSLTEIIVRNPDLMTNKHLQSYASKLHYGAEQNTVTFNTMGGASVPNQVIDFGEFASEPTAEKTGHSFIGWYLDEQYTQPFTFDTPIKYDITLYAKWQINQYTVEFWWQNGTHTGSQTVDYGTLVQRPTDPTKEGYTFVGWFTDDLYQHPYDFSTPVTKDFGLFAQWTINQYTVTFDSKQGSSVLPQTVNWKTKISRPSDPVREGYDFLGWYLNNEEYNFDEFVTDNMTLTAKWKSNNPDIPDEPETPVEENTEVSNKNNNGLIWGIAGTAAGILIVGGIVFGIVISKRRRK